MGFFGRKKEQQNTAADELKISFEGQTPAVSADFGVDYNDILRGLEVIDANEDKTRIWGGLAVLTVCAVIAIPRIFGFSKIFGVIFVLLLLYIIGAQVLGPAINRKNTAQKTVKENKAGTVHLFPGGYQVVIHGVPYNVPFRVVTCYETDTCYVFVLGKVQMMVFNKSIFGEKNPLVKEILVANMGLGRRYFKVDEKGKVIKGQGQNPADQR